MNILIADLDENASGGVEQFAREQEPVAQVGEVGMEAQSGELLPVVKPNS